MSHVDRKISFLLFGLLFICLVILIAYPQHAVLGNGISASDNAEEQEDDDSDLIFASSKIGKGRDMSSSSSSSSNGDVSSTSAEVALEGGDSTSSSSSASASASASVDIYGSTTTDSSFADVPLVAEKDLIVAYLDKLAATHIKRVLLKEVGNVIFDISAGRGALIDNLLDNIFLKYFVIFEGDKANYDVVMTKMQNRYLLNYGLILLTHCSYNLFDEFHYEGDLPGRCQIRPDDQNHELRNLCEAFSVNSLTKFTMHSLSPYMIFMALSRLCPTIVILHSESDSYRAQVKGFAMELLSLIKILEFCRPTIYIHNLDPYNAQIAIDFLLQQGFTHDDLFWNVYPYTVDATNSSSCGVSSLSVDLIAFGTRIKDIETAISDGISNHGYVQLQPNKYYITEYPEFIDLLILHSSVFTAWSPSCPDGGMPPCRIIYIKSNIKYVKTAKGNYDFDFMLENSLDSSSLFYIENLKLLPPLKITVNFTDLITTFESERESAQTVFTQIRDHIKAIPALQTRSFEFDYFKSDEDISSLIILFCRNWINDIQQEFIPKTFLVSIFDKEDPSLTKAHSFKDFVIIMYNSYWQCSNFAFKLAQTYRRSRANVHRATKDFPNSVFPIEEENEEEGEVVRKDKDDSNSRDSFNPLLKTPFAQTFDPENCFEPIYCNNSMQMLNRLHVWQNPRGGTSEESKGGNGGVSSESSYLKGSRMSKKFSCSQAKYVVYQPLANMHGIGSLLTQIISLLRYAICMNRILIYDLPKFENKYLSKWKVPGCYGKTLDCYFEPISHCSGFITEEDVRQAPVIKEGLYADSFSFKHERVIVVQGLPVYGPCAICNSDWSGSKDIFDGLNMNAPELKVAQKVLDEASDTMLPNSMPRDNIYKSLTALSDEPLFGDQNLDLNHYSSYTGHMKQPWMSFMMRYVMRVRPWLAQVVQDIASSSLVGPRGKIARNIPRPFASLHIRYGAKRLETELFPLDRYMYAVRHKHPEVKNIFVSTETEALIKELQNQYPEYNFYFLKYDRLEILDFVDSRQDPLYKQDFVDEFIYSMANLFVSVEADAFVGTLSSNWCVLINYLQRTRGDGGEDYQSVDGGSSYSVCF